MFRMDILELFFFFGLFIAAVLLGIAIQFALVELKQIRVSFERIATALERRPSD